MEQRQLGKNGPFLTTIGLGAWAIGGPWEWGWGEQDDQDSIATILRAVDLGINWIDTAAVYGLGHSEEIVGRAIKRLDKSVFVATKCGLVWDSRGRVARNLRPESIRKEVDASLKRLGVETIDLYQFHWPDPEVPVEDSWGEMTRLQEQGKVHYIGVCNFDEELLRRCLTVAPVQSLQPPYSIIRRDYEPVLPFCRENGIGVVVYSPLQAGLLTGKFDPERLAEDDWRRRSKEHTEPRLSRNLALVEELKPIARSYGKTVSQLAVAWTLMNPAVTSAIVGARRPAQIEETAGGANFRLSASDMDRIEELCQKILGEE